ncbi:DUF3795 domain-containing protein [Chloroflexota bacterium]
MSIREIGCCGTYCRTCRESTTGSYCRGCKLGYENGQRDINKAKCKIKLCCFRDRKLETCADCVDYTTCDIIGSFQNRKGMKYKKYKLSIEFIKENGYDSFLNLAKYWTGPYGKL